MHVLNRLIWERDAPTCMPQEGSAGPLRDTTGTRTGKPNRLVHEKSPYLLQHAGNPVNWYPWGDEAFNQAKKDDRPIFLSIGYSTCHWCHVMAHESFEDPGIAALLNGHFICIKVDREERPDIDSVYMTACQQMTGQGGWPLTIFMTPERKPFLTATYIPKTSRFGMTGLDSLLANIITLWRERRDDIYASADGIASIVQHSSQTTHKRIIPGSDLLKQGYEALAGTFDPVSGGFGRAPKFPSPHTLIFLLRYWKRTGNERALSMVEKTLGEIRKGGIFDQVGFGVHRYSTDALWRVPHFEKMLYDQAMLVMAYTEAYQATKCLDYKKSAEEIITYVLRHMISPDGAFCSAEDADSPGGEGAYYTWTIPEIQEVLGTNDTAIAKKLYNLTQNGNYCNADGDCGKNILYRTHSTEDLAQSFRLSSQVFETHRESIRTHLFEARGARHRPERDDKVLTDWNALFCHALAQAALVFNEPRYIAAAVRAMEFVLTRVRTGDGGLMHRFRDGDAGIPAFADDYAFTIRALIALYETTFITRYLIVARELNAFFMAHFWDKEQGGFFTAGDRAETLLVRKKEYYDGAIPSGNSVAFENLVLLSRLTGDASLEEQASMLAQIFTGEMERSMASCAWFLAALDYALGPAHELVIVGEIGAPDTRAMLEAIRSEYLPSVTILLRQPCEQGDDLPAIAPFTKDFTMHDGKATAYVCYGHTCTMPVSDPEKVLELVGVKTG
jgi:uncharacterized protein